MNFNNIIFSDVSFNDKFSAWIEHYSFAFFLIETLRPETFVELGTHNGGSYFAFCQTIKTLQINTRAYAVDTWQGDEQSGFYDEEVYNYVNQTNKENFAYFSTLLKTTFDNAGQSFEDGSIDLLHIDGLHTYQAVKHDFEKWLPKMSDTGVMIFHDTAVRNKNFGVWRLMEELRNKYTYFEFEHGYGLGIVCVGSKISEIFLNFVNTANANDFIKKLFSSIGRKNLLEYQQKELAGQIKKLTYNLELIPQTIRQNYQVQQILQHSEILDNLYNKIYFAQLYYKNINSQYDEKQSLISEVNIGVKKLCFKFNNNFIIKQLRFDPLNDFVSIRINTIQFLNNGKPLDIEFELTSNAIIDENGIYLFDTTDSQVFIDFPLEKIVELDEVIIDLEYFQKGLETLPQLLKQKNIENELSNNKILVLTTSLQKTEYQKNCLEKKLSENNITLQKQAEKIDLQSGLLNTLKKSNDEILKQYNNLEMQIGRLNSELVNIKKSFSYKFFSLLNILLLVFNPLKFIGLIKRRLKLNRNFLLIRQSDFFNTDYYLKNNPDVKQTEKSAIRHYLLYGGFEGRKPSEKFDSASYLTENPDIKENGINPLVHYLKYGSKEGRLMHK